MAVRIRKGTSLELFNLTPMIDVVFLLLIFFLVATRFAKEDRELDVLLPSASEARPLIAEPHEVFINVDQQGTIYVDGKVMQLEEVEDILRQAITNNPGNQKVIIRADRRVQFQSVVDVMNVCNRVGIADYSVTTEAPEHR